MCLVLALLVLLSACGPAVTSETRTSGEAEATPAEQTASASSSSTIVLHERIGDLVALGDNQDAVEALDPSGVEPNANMGDLYDFRGPDGNLWLTVVACATEKGVTMIGLHDHPDNRAYRTEEGIGFDAEQDDVVATYGEPDRTQSFGPFTSHGYEGRDGTRLASFVFREGTPTLVEVRLQELADRCE